LLLTDGPEGRNCVRTTTYYAFMLFKAHRGKTAVPVEGGTDDQLATGRQTMLDGEPPDVPDISASRSGSRAGRQPGEPAEPTTTWKSNARCAAPGPSGASAQILHDSDLNAYNSFDHPDRVTIRPHAVAVEPDRLRIMLPAMSVATVTLDIE
jgi:alpha-L-arabinofuranosidase